MIHQLRREWWRVLMLAGGAIWSLSLIPAVVWARRSLAESAVDVRQDALLVVSLVLILGWVVVPLLITGLDDTLDPGRFASLGLRADRLMPGLTVASFLTLPALFFFAVMAILGFSWSSEGTAVLAVALGGGALTVVMMVLSARLAVMWASRLLASRRSRDVALVAVAAGLALVAPAAWVLFQDGFEVVLEYDVRVLLEQLGVTPLGAGVSAATAAVAGDWVGVGWRLVMVVAWIVVLHRAWHANVAYSLVHPIYRGGGTRQREDTVLAAASKPRRDLGRLSPSIPTIAVRTRVLRSWRSDPRYLANAAGVLAFPVVYLALVMPAFGLAPQWAFIAPILLASSIGWGRHNDVAYDSTALWLDVVSGKLGEHIMRGRMAAIVAWAAPAVLGSALLIVMLTGLWGLGPALIGTCVGVLGVTLGMSAITSVALPYRAPAPGENPFSAEVGSVGASLLAQLVSSLGVVVVLPLVTGPFFMALRGDLAWGWLAFISGLVLGPLALWWGVKAAGAIYDRRAGHLVAAVA